MFPKNEKAINKLFKYIGWHKMIFFCLTLIHLFLPKFAGKILESLCEKIFKGVWKKTAK
jgi:hypothetical protein